MATIDDKVVAMSFEASKFESGVNTAISALEKLKASLKLPAASKGLDDVGAAAKRLDLSHISRSVDTLVQKLNYFSVAAIAIFTNVAMKAVQAGAQMVKGLTIDPIIQGYKEYSTQLNSIQTILANTQAAGTNLKQVNATLQELNEYSDKTIYNFSEMARNIGTFTAAGVDLKTSTAAIKGIANLAALSGSNSQQAATAMYQLSQAIAAGRVSLMDWNSVVNAGMGGTVFQRALAQTAVAMGKLPESAVKLVGPMKNVSIHGQSFRNAIATKPGEKSWLTSDVLTTALKTFTSDMSDAELAAIGFSREQIKAIQLQAKTAMFAATEVKTLSQVLDVAKETAGSGWAQTWQIIFGDFGEAKKTFTALSNTINGFINANADARNKVLKDWKDLGGRTVLINAIKTAFQNLGAIIAPIKEAFRDIFPAKTGKDLYDATLGFQNFAKSLKPSAETVENLKRTFAGVFAALDIGKQIVSGIFTVFKELFGALGGGNGGFLELTGSIGDWIVKIDKALKKGDALHNFFVSLGQVLAKPVEMLSAFAGAVGEAIGAISSGGISTGLNGMTEAATPLQVVLEALGRAWDSFSNSIKNSVDMESVLKSIGTAVSGIGVALGNALSSMNFEVILSAIKTGLFGALVLMFREFLGKGSFLSQISTGFSRGILSNISGMFSGLSGSMKAFQQNIRAKTLKEIALAMALLAASVLMLSLIKPERLNAALGAMTIMFGELIGAMALLDKATKSAGFIKMPIMVASLTGLAVAIDLLTIAVLAMSRLSWDELVKGLTGVGGLLAGISVAAKPLSASSGGLIRASVGMIAIGVALNILALAVKQFGGMSMEELAKGLGSVAISLGILVAAAKVMPSGMVVMGAGLIVVATGLKILAGAVAQFGALDWRTMGRGLVGIAGSLTAIALSMRLMPKTLAITGAGLLLVALSLGKISDAVAKMGGMSISQIAKGLGTLAASLLILAVSLRAMTGTLAGAAALTVAAAGIALLAPALTMLGRQSWSQILKGMVALGAALVILGVAGIALGPVVPALLGLGAAVVLIGGGLALAGAGILMFSAGLSALAVAGPAAVGILVAAINEFLLAVPKMASSFALALLAVVDAFAQTAPQFVAAMVKIIDSLLNVIIQSSPKMVQAIIALVDVLLQVLAARQNEIIAAGFALLMALLRGLKDNIAQVTTTVIQIIVTFLQTIANNMGKIVTAGMNILIQLLKGIANNIARVVLAATEIVTKFITAIGAGWTKIITAGANVIVRFVEGLAKNFGKLVQAGADAIVEVVKGIGSAANKIVNAATSTAGTFIINLAKAVVKLANDVATAIITLLNGVAGIIENRSPEVYAAMARIGLAMVKGLCNAIAAGVIDVKNALLSLIPGPLKKFAGKLGITSPSTVFYAFGQNIVQGLVNGISDGIPAVGAAMGMLGNGVVSGAANSLKNTVPAALRELGAFINHSFIQGLRGAPEDIRDAFVELNQKLTEAISTSRQTIASEQKKLKELLGAEKPDLEAIREAQRIISVNQTILSRSIATRTTLRTKLQDERKELIALSAEYERNNQKIEAAREKLKQLIAEKEAFIKSTTEQYSELPQIQTTDEEGNALTPEQQVQRYLEALKTQSEAVATYKTTLEQLRELGLDDATYQKLLEEGTADQAFADQLLAGGKTAIEGLNKLDKQLQNVSKSLATEAAKNLKDAGIQGAKGLLAGLTSQNKKIRQAMDDIIEEIIAIIKRKLHIKSPSEVFETIGIQTMQGLADGFAKSSKFVVDAFVAVTDNAINSMKDSMNRISDSIAQGLDQNPVITPILDLSDVKEKVKDLTDLTNINSNVTPITAAASCTQAATIAAAVVATELATNLSDAISAAPITTVQFEQNNYSPTALTGIEIYRQTKNQLSQVKALLGEPINLPVVGAN